MLKLNTGVFIADKNLYNSTVELLSDSYLNAKNVLETALSKSDIIYVNQDDNIVTSIALCKCIRLQEFDSYKMVYIGMTAARKASKKGMAYQLVIQLLRDNFATIEENENLYAISTISTPFTYNYYKRFTKELYPTCDGFIPSAYETLFQSICHDVLYRKDLNNPQWLFKRHTQTRYNEEELNKINTYLNKNFYYLFDKEHFDLTIGDRVAVLGLVDRNIINV